MKKLFVIILLSLLLGGCKKKNVEEVPQKDVENPTIEIKAEEVTKEVPKAEEMLTEQKNLPSIRLSQELTLIGEEMDKKNITTLKPNSAATSMLFQQVFDCIDTHWINRDFVEQVKERGDYESVFHSFDFQQTEGLDEKDQKYRYGCGFNDIAPSDEWFHLTSITKNSKEEKTLDLILKYAYDMEYPVPTVKLDFSDENNVKLIIDGKEEYDYIGELEGIEEDESIVVPAFVKRFVNNLIFVGKYQDQKGESYEFTSDCEAIWGKHRYSYDPFDLSLDHCFNSIYINDEIGESSVEFIGKLYGVKYVDGKLCLYDTVSDDCGNPIMADKPCMILTKVEDGQVVAAQEDEQDNPINMDLYALMIGRSKQEVIEMLGDHYYKRATGISKQDQGLYYDDIHMSFFFNGDDRLQYIEYNGDAQFLHKKAYDDFNTIQEEYGEANVVEYEIKTDENRKGMVQEHAFSDVDYYEISYPESEYLISFVSKKETGENFTIYIYKPVGFLSSAEIKGLLDCDLEQIENRFGKDCILGYPADEAWPSWEYYRAIGLYFGENCDPMEEKDYIQFAPDIEYESFHTGMSFEEVKKIKGDTRVIKESRYMFGYIDYTIEYRDKDYCLSFESTDERGTDSIMQIAKTAKGYRDRIRDDVQWNFYRDNIGFVYQGKEYILDMDCVIDALPMYDSCNYEYFGIPENALGAGVFIGGYTGSIECFYIALDQEENLNLYVKRNVDSAKTDQQAKFTKEQVIKKEDDISNAGCMIIDCDRKQEISEDDISSEDLKAGKKITRSLKKKELYCCFSLRDYKDTQWPKIIDKKVYYDFNRDGKLEELAIHYSCGTRSDNSKDEDDRDTVIEITLANQKIIMKEQTQDFPDFNAGICDVDLNDDHIDIYTTSYEGCYGKSKVFRFNGDHLEKVCDMGYDELVGVSGDGKIYTWAGCFSNTFGDERYDDLALWYIDYKTGESVSNDDIIGKKYKAGYGDILFLKKEDVPCGPPVEVTMGLEGAIYEPKQDEVLTIIDKDDSYQALKVKTKDGTIGWIGGHHMVWD